MTYIEKACSYCGVINYDSDFGVYGNKHINRKSGNEEKCDTNGNEYKSSGPDPLANE